VQILITTVLVTLAAMLIMLPQVRHLVCAFVMGSLLWPRNSSKLLRCCFLSPLHVCQRD
jgi:hypothetical protein